MAWRELQSAESQVNSGVTKTLFSGSLKVPTRLPTSRG